MGVAIEQVKYSHALFATPQPRPRLVPLLLKFRHFSCFFAHFFKRFSLDFLVLFLFLFDSFSSFAFSLHIYEGDAGVAAAAAAVQ